MADEMTFTVTWNKGFDKRIVGIANPVLNRMAEEAVAEAKRRSPYKTGNNKRHIDWDTPERRVRRIFTTSGYGGLLEVGTGIHGPKKRPITLKSRSGKTFTSQGMRARPYIRPAIEDVRRRAEEILAKVIKGLK